MIRRSRLARVALALFLVPVVIFANPQTANAAAWHQVTITGGGGIPGDNFECWMPLQMHSSGQALNIGDGARCWSTMPNTTPYYSQEWEDGAPYEISATGTRSDGSSCAGIMRDRFGPYDHPGSIGVSGSILAGSGDAGILLSVPSDQPDCTVQQVCIESLAQSGCAAVNIGPPETPSNLACPNGSVKGYPLSDPASYARVPDGASSPRGYWDNESARMESTATGGWIEYAIYANVPLGSGLTAPADGRQIKFFYFPRVATPGVTLGQEIWTANVNGPYSAPAAGGTSPLDDDLLVGRGVYWAGSATSNLEKTIPSSGGNIGTGRLGITEPQLCAWYWGDRIAVVAGEADAPIGPVPTNPNPETPDDPLPTPPTIEDPDEGFDWLAAIWAVLRGIASTLAGMASAIANAITSALSALVDAVLAGIEALFVPSDGFLDQQVERLEDSFDGTTLGNYTDALGDLAPSGASGCEGPSVRMSTKAPASTPLSACGGAAATLASASRLVITISVGIAAGLAVVRILGRGIGWDPTPGGGAS